MLSFAVSYVSSLMLLTLSPAVLLIVESLQQIYSALYGCWSISGHP